MNRKVLLLEPNYSNKYPPMGLMKLATYYRECSNDDVRFYKGNLNDLGAKLLCEEYYEEVNSPDLGKHFSKLVTHVKTGKNSPLEEIPNFRHSSFERKLREYRLRYKSEDFPKFDIVCVTTLFTFYWNEIISTINFAKKICKSTEKIHVGGIAATILPKYVYEETGIQPHVGLLNKAGILDEGDSTIIDELPLDYSILEEVDYQYPANNAYLAYMTRGCVNKCPFCAVPRLEPIYQDYISLKQQLENAEKRFGPKKDLLLMDNNVFASKHFNKIIDEIKDCGFGKGATYLPMNEYKVAINNLTDSYNIRGYTKKIITIYNQIAERLHEDEAGMFYLEREKRNLLYPETASREEILGFDNIVRPLYEKYFRKLKRVRFLDFNQGVDARLIDDKKMKKLAEVAIRPLRIAFDHYAMAKVYVRAVKLAAKHGIKDLSNYLLYNFEDKPEDLYYRMKMNIDLCEELGVTIYSFPMKYHPIDDPEYFRNRDYIGKHWNRKFIRSIQAVLNATKGKIGRGKEFFEEAFGKDVDEFRKILWMPEVFIIYRRRYDKDLRERLADKYTKHYNDENDLVNEWWHKFTALNESQQEVLKNIVSTNRFTDEVLSTCLDADVCEVLQYYCIRRKSSV